METWKTINEEVFGDWYEVSDKGNVRSYRSTSGIRRTVPKPIYGGYHYNIWGGYFTAVGYYK